MLSIHCDREINSHDQFAACTISVFLCISLYNFRARNDIIEFLKELLVHTNQNKFYHSCSAIVTYPIAARLAACIQIYDTTLYTAWMSL